MNHLEKVAMVGRTMFKVLKSSLFTSCVICFDKSASEMLEIVIKEGMENHYGIA